MVCGRAGGRDVVVDGMLWRTAGKSARYSSELVVPEPLDILSTAIRPTTGCKDEFYVGIFLC